MTPPPAQSRLALWVLRAIAWGLGLWPAVELGGRIALQQLGANPVETLSHATGIWALRLLLLSLAMTPLRRLSGRVEFVQVRRLLGLWAYAWVCVHFSIYLVLDLQGSPAQLAEDLVQRRYVTVGFIAWLLLLPLAVTSTRAWQRRLRRRWKQLHRLAYVAALLGGVHFLWLAKSDLREPLVYLAILLLLMALRLPWRRHAAASGFPHARE